jgi:hypothetical protein
MGNVYKFPHGIPVDYVPPTRLPSADELHEIMPQQFRKIPIKTQHDSSPMLIAWLLIASMPSIGIAAYGAYRFGGEMVRLALQWW